MNDFAIDHANIVLKCLVEIKIYNKSTEKIELELRYIVLSDSMLLLFAPEGQSKNLAKLIFFSSLAHIEYINTLEMNVKTEKLLNKKDKKINCYKSLKNLSNTSEGSTFLRFQMKWKVSDIYLGEISGYDNILIMDFDDIVFLDKQIKEKRTCLMNASELFSEDYIIPSNSLALKSFKETKLVELVMYHEKFFLKTFETANLDRQETQMLLKEQAKEILFLYQKIVEILSMRNDNNYNVYILKMQKFLEIARSFLEDLKDHNFMLLDCSFT